MAADEEQPRSPMEALLYERLQRATTPEERQAAWDDLVAYQRRSGVRAQPKDIQPPQV
jgi:hypothetical protein